LLKIQAKNKIPLDLLKNLCYNPKKFGKSLFNHHLINNKKFMKNKILVAITSIFIAFGANSAFAEEKIAILDIEKIAKEAKAVLSIQKLVSKKQDQFQIEINKKQDVLEADQKKIEAKRNILSKEAFDKEQNAFAKKVEDLKEFVAQKQTSLKKASAEAMEKVNDKMKDVVEDIAKEKQITLILPASQVIFSVDGLDITDEVLVKLDKKISKVSVNF